VLGHAVVVDKCPDVALWLFLPAAHPADVNRPGVSRVR
jgi:hypothetical protein